MFSLMIFINNIILAPPFERWRQKKNVKCSKYVKKKKLKNKKKRKKKKKKK